MDTQEHAICCVWIHFIPTSFNSGEKKNIWSELGLNPGPLASQATALTTRPWLLRCQSLTCLRSFFLSPDRSRSGFPWRPVSWGRLPSIDAGSSDKSLDRRRRFPVHPIRKVLLRIKGLSCVRCWQTLVACIELWVSPHTRQNVNSFTCKSGTQNKRGPIIKESIKA